MIDCLGTITTVANAGNLVIIYYPHMAKAFHALSRRGLIKNVKSYWGYRSCTPLFQIKYFVQKSSSASTRYHFLTQAGA